jgi:flagellar motor switch protein FliN/FliY
MDGLSEEEDGGMNSQGQQNAFHAGGLATMALMNDIELEATLQFGSRELALREVLELGPGDVVELDRHISEPVDLVVGDRIVARGEVVVASGNFALRITEVATPQLRLESIRCLF